MFLFPTGQCFRVHGYGERRLPTTGNRVLFVGFCFGVGSRYTYLAATRLRVLEAETGAVQLARLDSARLIAARGHNPFSALGGAGRYDWAYWQADAEAWADLYGVPFREPHGRIALDPDLLSLACTAARRLGAAEAYARALFRAVSADDLPAVDRAMCVERAAEAGLGRAAFADALGDAGTRAERERVQREAAGRGAFGVPTFVFGNRLFWGNDRLPLLRHALLQARRAAPPPAA